MDIQAAADRFCHLIETAPTYSRDAFVEEVVRALTALIAAGAAMAPVELPGALSADDYDGPEIPDEVWRERFAEVGRVLAEWDHYWTVNPLSIKDETAPECTVGDLNDDLADTWRDLKEGLLGLEQGGPEAVIHWQWRWGYYSHWGVHATQALAVLHARLRETEIYRMG